MADEPSRHEIVVVGIECIFLPSFVLETFQEIRALQNFSPVGTSPARHARGAAINVVSRRDLEITTLNVCCSKPVPAFSRPVPTSVSPYPLTGANTPDLGVVEWGKNPRHQRRRPSDIVICHDDDTCLDMGQCFTDLEALVGNTAAQHSDVPR